MIWTNLTKLAYAVALGAHAGQRDKAGRPYIEHPLYVASQMTDGDHPKNCVNLQCGVE